MPAAHNNSSSIHDRARAYLERVEPAVSGQGGHDAMFRAALALLQDFALSREAARPLLREYNARCAPPFSERDLEHKLLSAQGKIDPARLGRLADSGAGRSWPDALHQFADVRGFALDALRALGAAASGAEVHTPERNDKGEATATNRRRGDNQPFDCGDKALVKKGGRRGLFMPWPLPAEGVVLVVEGMPDAARALTARWRAVVGLSNDKPGRPVLRMLARLLAGRDVVIVPDPGKAGLASLAQVGRFLANAGCRVRFVPAGDQDLDERLRTELDQATELARIVAEEALPWRHEDEARGGKDGAAAPCPVFDEQGDVIPLGVARAIGRKRPDLICVNDQFWEFTGKIFEPIKPAIVDGDSIALIGEKSRRSNHADIRHLLAVERHRADDFFDPQGGRWIVVENGVIDVETMELLPHNAGYRARNLLPVSYDPAADCPRFKQALEEWLPDDQGARALLVEWLGYTLFPDTRHEKALFLLGEGANGKGRFVRVQEALLGKHNISGLPLLSFRSDRTFMTAGLEGRLVNICPESELPSSLDEGLIKSLISGDTVSVERKGKDPFLMRPFARFVIQSNNPPRLSDKSEGVWRRLMIVRFTKTFPEAERDKDLDAKLAAELPGILNLALEGLCRLDRRGCFDLTPAMVADLRVYREENNPLLAWKEESLIENPVDYMGRTIWTPTNEVYENYRKWCKRNGHCNVFARIPFTREVKRLGVEQGTTRDRFDHVIKAFKGVTLREG